MGLPDFIHESVEYLRGQQVANQPEAAVILGSGLGSFGEQIQDTIRMPYSLIPRFPSTSVKGHEGALISGTIRDKNILAFSGRFHYYEGFSFEQAALPVYITKALGAGKLIISNAAGAINRNFKVGDLMIIDDVMRQNLQINPVSSSKYYYNHYPTAERARKIAARSGIDVQRGTYLYAKGPNYETKAEIRAFRVMGADAVGMSTAPELFESARLNLKSVAISLISNMAAGLGNAKLNHEEVKQAAALRKDDFAKLVKRLIINL